MEQKQETVNWGLIKWAIPTSVTHMGNITCRVNIRAKTEIAYSYYKLKILGSDGVSHTSYAVMSKEMNQTGEDLCCPSNHQLPPHLGLKTWRSTRQWKVGWKIANLPGSDANWLATKLTPTSCTLALMLNIRSICWNPWELNNLFLEVFSPLFFSLDSSICNIHCR